MGSDGDVVILGDDVDILVARMRDEIDLGMAAEKLRHDIAHGELHCGHGCSAAHGTDRFLEPMAYGGLRRLGLAQHHHRVTIKFLAGISHPKLS